MIANDDSTGVQKVIEFGATLEPVDVNGRTALHYLMFMKNSADAFKFILSQEHLKGTYDVNESTRGGVTPLMLAVKLDQENTVELLLQQGANPFLKDSLG